MSCLRWRLKRNQHYVALYFPVKLRVRDGRAGSWPAGNQPEQEPVLIGGDVNSKFGAPQVQVGIILVPRAHATYAQMKRKLQEKTRAEFPRCRRVIFLS